MIRLCDVRSGAVLATGVDAVRRSAAWLDEGGVLAHPTATVYGLGGRPGPDIDAEIARLKGRNPKHPLIRVAANVDELRRAVPMAEWTAGAARLAARFWPGPLTLVLSSRGADSKGGVAVRVDAHPVLRRVLQESGGVMTSTSLNLAGEAPAETAGQARAVVERFPAARRPLSLLEAGAVGPSIPSTILSLADERPRLLREGAIAWSEINEVLSIPVQGSRL